MSFARVRISCSACAAFFNSLFERKAFFLRFRSGGLMLKHFICLFFAKSKRTPEFGMREQKDRGRRFERCTTVLGIFSSTPPRTEPNNVGPCSEGGWG